MNRFTNSKFIKTSLYVILGAFFFAGCKEKVDLPKETFDILANHSIQIVRYPNTPWNRFRVEGGSNKHVVFYTHNLMDLIHCNDCGNPFIAFEIDPSLATFNYTSPEELKNVRAIRGQTGSFFGPYAYSILSGKITGQKTRNKSWLISIELPADSTSSGQPFQRTGIFTIR